MQRRNINTSTRQLPVTTSSLLLSLHICIAAKYGSHGGGAQSLLGRNPIHDEWMFSPVRTGDRGFSVSWEGCHSKAWWAHQPVAVGQCLFVVWQPEGSFASCPPFGWLQAARVVQDLEGQPGQDWSPVEWLPDPKLHLLWQCHLWLLCLIFQVVTLLFWQPRAAQLKKEQEKQLANRKSYIGEIILDICKQIYIYIHLLALPIWHLFPRSCATRKPFRHWNAPYKGKGSSDAPPPIDLDPPQSLGLHSFSKYCTCASLFWLANIKCRNLPWCLCSCSRGRELKTRRHRLKKASSGLLAKLVEKLPPRFKIESHVSSYTQRMHSL